MQVRYSLAILVASLSLILSNNAWAESKSSGMTSKNSAPTTSAAAVVQYTFSDGKTIPSTGSGKIEFVPGTPTATRSITATNSGNKDVAISMNPVSGPFVVQQNTCIGPLKAGGGTCTVVIYDNNPSPQQKTGDTAFFAGNDKAYILLQEPQSTSSSNSPLASCGSGLTCNASNSGHPCILGYASKGLGTCQNAAYGGCTCRP